MDKTTTSTPIRHLMPEGYTAIISQETGMDPGNVSKVVTAENNNSWIWPIVERLAKEVDSKAYTERLKFLERRNEARKALKMAYKRSAA